MFEALRCVVSDKSIVGLIIMLISCVIDTNGIEIKCKNTENSNEKICSHPFKSFRVTCCYNFEMNYYYCCPIIEARRWDYRKRFNGLIASVILITVFILFLCIYCTRCPLGNSIHRRRQTQGE
ncbi:uncharacterized protein LOC130670045 [Microplitis mediator]|uniref:uncharacterized protein LOC130670045 n=1 Tax=Microplitis mediator TaxID=375433 RepID=UPI0025548E07|nr:uncharacterized protein LOC130670045 [Microplitis mediator]